MPPTQRWWMPRSRRSRPCRRTLEIVPGLGKVYEATPEDDYGAPPQVQRQRRPTSNVKRSAKDLEGDVTILPGIGPNAAEQLARLGLVKVVDLLWHLHGATTTTA